MPRLHLVELEDLPWIPDALRNALTGYLQAMLDATDPYAPAVPVLVDALRRSDARRIVDLCSGGGGPWKRLRAALVAAGSAVPVVLTDRYPNPGAVAAAGGGDGAIPISMHAGAVDATRVPESLGGLRTVFTAFHHFAPDAARAVLRDAVARGEPIAIFEATKRNTTCILVTLLSPIATLVMMPRVRPFRWTNLLFTYLIPIVPLMVAWDGVVSCLRTYEPEELNALVASIDGHEGYEWAVGERATRGPIPVTYLVGTPRSHQRA
jgi:hypothetical protein